MLVSKRNVSLDLLKCISMLMVVMIHAVGKDEERGFGSIIVSLNTLNIISLLIKTFSLVAVNCFILITGYFLCESKFHYHKAISLWITVFVYSFGLYFLIAIVPFTNTQFKLIEIAKSVFPVVSGYYWFFTVYFILYLFSPYLNKLISSLNKKEHRWLIILLLLFSFISDSISIDFIHKFIYFSGGYSLIWFIVLYLIASYIRRYDLKNNKYGLLYIVCSLITFALLVGQYILNSNFLNKYFNLFTSYNSIFVLIASVSLFMFFKNHPIKSDGKLSKIIIKVSSLTFGIYLFSEHPYIRPIIWQKIVCLQNYQDSPVKLFAVMFVSVILIYIVGLIVEWLRQLVFKYIYPIIFKMVDKLPFLNKKISET